MDQVKRLWPLIVAALLALTVTVTVTMVDDDGDGPNPPRPKVEIIVATVKDADGESVKVAAPAPVVEAAKEELHDDLAEPGDEPTPLAPLATPRSKGCVTRIVANKSSRNGATPRQVWLHYTVSRNRPGWSDVNAIVGLFNNPSFQASSHYVFDAEGNCAFIVPESMKAWTQATANPIAVSIEFIAFGDERRLLEGAALAKAGRLVGRIAERHRIPLVRGGAGCGGSPAGVVQHADGGACAGGHTDINPFPVKPVIAAARDSFDAECARRAKPGKQKHFRTLGRVGLKCEGKRAVLR